MDRKQDRVGQAIEALEAKCQAYAGKNAQLEAKVAELASEVTLLRAELNQKGGVKHQAREFYRAFDNAVQHRLHVRGYKRPDMRHWSISPEVLASNDKTLFMTAAREYDVHTYFEAKPRQAYVRLRYRIASKVYRTSRDVAVKGTKIMLRAVKKAVR